MTLRNSCLAVAVAVLLGGCSDREITAGSRATVTKKNSVAAIGDNVGLENRTEPKKEPSQTAQPDGELTGELNSEEQSVTTTEESLDLNEGPTLIDTSLARDAIVVDSGVVGSGYIETKRVAGTTDVFFINGSSGNSLKTTVELPAECDDPLIFTQSYTNRVDCANADGKGPGTCNNDPNATSSNLRSFATGIDKGAFQVLVSSANTVWVGEKSPAFPIGWMATCREKMAPPPKGAYSFAGKANVTFENGLTRSATVRVKYPATCQDPVILVNSSIESLHCGDANGENSCFNDPETESTAVRPTLGKRDNEGFVTFLSVRESVFVGAISPQFEIRFHVTCQSVAGAAGDLATSYSGVASTMFLNDQRRSASAVVSFATDCAEPVVITQPYTDALDCGDADGRTACANDPGATTEDVWSYVTDITTTGFKTYLSAASGVFVGESSPMFPIAFVSICKK